LTLLGFHFVATNQLLVAQYSIGKYYTVSYAMGIEDPFP
jgi:hypothetical protein